MASNAKFSLCIPPLFDLAGLCQPPWPPCPCKYVGQSGPLFEIPWSLFALWLVRSKAIKFDCGPTGGLTWFGYLRIASSLINMGSAG